MLGSLWEAKLEEQAKAGIDARPPVFILVCKNTEIAKVIHGWLANGESPAGVPPANLPGFRNGDGVVNTIRVDSKVAHETDTGEAKGDEVRWTRFTLDTVGRLEWPADRQGRPVMPEGFAELASKLSRPLHPPGRDVRCIVSVGMLTEGWDCNTVTHVVGLRPFMSQLLCEQVVGRGLRRASYEVNADGKLSEEVAKVFGVPFEVIPFKANTQGPPPEPVKRYHVRALPERAALEIRFPRVDGYTQAIRNRIAVDWSSVARLRLDPTSIPTEVETKGLSLTVKGGFSLSGPGRADDVTLREFRSKRREQELVFDLARDLTRRYARSPGCTVPPHQLFPQFRAVADRFLRTKVDVTPKADVRDVFLAPYYGWALESLVQATAPDTSAGEAPELPIYEAHRPPGTTADVDFWTSRDVREVERSHLNYVVADTKRWEQIAAFAIDKHPNTAAFVKNANMGFSIPYLHSGEPHDYVPDFIVRLKSAPDHHVIVETKGFDPTEEVKVQAAQRWVNAVNAEASFGTWSYHVAKKPDAMDFVLRAV